MANSSRIYIAGHRGMVGSAIQRALRKKGFEHLITRSRNELNLTDQSAVREFFATEKIDEVYLAAAKVGGIYANNEYPADFIYQNLMIQANIIHEAWRAGVKKLLFLGSSCIYPKHAPQPMAEDSLLTGRLEPTNEPYAIAKIAGIKLSESYNRQHGTDFRSVMPTNLYGPGDNYHPDYSHVLPALLRRLHMAKNNNAQSIPIWGSGKPRREFLYVDDMADACIHVMNLDKTVYQQNTGEMGSHINVGTGSDISIGELAELLKEVVDYKGELTYDSSKPDGAPQKLLDVSLLERMGWSASVSLIDGIKATYNDFISREASRRIG
ncbi:GDP-L-fucose synthase [Cupriavidus sp. CP313]